MAFGEEGKSLQAEVWVVFLLLVYSTIMTKLFSNKIAMVIALLIVLGALVYGFDILKPKPAPQPPQIKKIGVVQIFSVIDSVYVGLKQGMEDLGYVEGKDVVYDYQNWDQNPAKIYGMVQDLIDKNVDLIYAITDESLLSALTLTKEAGKPIPIVFVMVEDPLGIDAIESFTSSGNNTTGIVSNFAEVVPKQLEFLKRFNPDVKRLGLFTEGFISPNGPGVPVYRKIKETAPKFGITVVEYTTDAEPGPALENAFDEIAKNIKPGEIDAIYHLPGHFVHDQQDREIQIGRRMNIINSMPVLEELRGTGGLFAYGSDLNAIGKQAAGIIDQIFKGAKPSDIPIGSPGINTLGINLNNAKDIGLTVPQDLIDIAGLILEE